MSRVLITLFCLLLVSIAAIVALFAATRSLLPPEILESFEGAQINSSIWLMDADAGCEIKISDHVSSGSNKVLAISAPTDARCEMVSWPSTHWLQWLQREPWGMPRSYQFRVFLPTDYEIPKSTDNEIVAQWHGSRDVWFGEKGGQGPPLALRISQDRWFITYGFDDAWVSERKVLASHRLWMGKIKLGEWSTWQFDVNWATDKTGHLAVYLNDILIAERTGPIGYRDVRGPYLKLGLYHPRVAHTIFLDDIAVTNIKGP